MFSKRKARLIVFVAAAAALGGGLFAYVPPASTSVNVDPAPRDARPGIADSAPFRLSSEYLSEDAVDSGGIENDLDGNAASLYASDQWCGKPTCSYPRLP
jgi:hypothetical protein